MTLLRAKQVTSAEKRRASTPTGARRDSARKREADEVASFVVIMVIFRNRFSFKACDVFLTATIASSPPQSHPARGASDPAAAVAKICCANGYRVRAFALRNWSIFE